MAVVGVIIITSWAYHEISVVGERDTRSVIERAAKQGDYQTAQALFEKTLDERRQSSVLGAVSELEDRVYPERVIARRIAELEIKLEEYPANKEIYLMLTSLYGQLGNTEKSDEYREKARILDPNDPQFQ